MQSDMSAPDQASPLLPTAFLQECGPLQRRSLTERLLDPRDDLINRRDHEILERIC